MKRGKPLVRRTPLTSHTGLRRTAPMTAAPLRTFPGAGLRRAPIAPQSAKRTAQMREYVPERDAFLAEHPVCQFPPGCDQWAMDVHHRKGRVGALLLDAAHWSALCRPHHIFVTEHPAAAVELGISEPRLWKETA